MHRQTKNSLYIAVSHIGANEDATGLVIMSKGKKQELVNFIYMRYSAVFKEDFLEIITYDFGL